MCYPIQYRPLLDIASDFKGILLDAYGVFWMGNEAGLFPDAKEAMKALVDAGKVVGILSNATRISSSEVSKLSRHGLYEGMHFHFLLTSGELTRQHALTNNFPFPTSSGKYFVLGGPYPGRSIHHEIFENTPFTETSIISEAEFIYVSTPQINGIDQIDVSVFEKPILQCLASKLPMLCANPDLHAHEGSPPKAVVRQGSLAKRYRELDGAVYYIGKPFHPAFSQAFNAFQKYKIMSPQEILMIGDTPETDIRGANQFGISSALITRTGIMADRIQEGRTIENILCYKEDQPHFFLENFHL
ncbi:MAG: TIGR01459 family HAD-type hydrolase [Chlamydiae bacterium]|nr:TIGR01459 family HAD-type hydrolase [Chlamydiota bacterium]